MTEDPGSRGTYTDKDCETEAPTRPTSGADEVRRAEASGRDETPDVEAEPTGAQEPPD